MLREARALNEQFESVSRARRLDEYYIPTRYPNGLPGTARPHEFYDEEEADECLRLAESIVDLINRIRSS